MLDENGIQVLRDLSIRIAAPINEYIIQSICERIAASGKFTATAEYLAYRAETLGLHWKQLKKELAKRLKVAQREIDRLYSIAAQRTYMDDIRRFKNPYPDFTRNPAVQQITRAAATLADRDFFNITQTLGMITPSGQELPLRKFYGKTMDYVFNNVVAGAMDYNTAIRTASTRLADKGVTVIGYESGVKTTLEAAVRRNVMGGLGLMVEQISQYNHEMVGANGWEISAHAMSAPDHEDIQGRQYSDKEYTALNNSLKRRIGTLNCGHNAFPIILGVNEPQYTDEQLQALKDKNAAGVTVDGKHYTMYGATQHMRAQERRIRALKRQNQAANATGDTERAMQTAGKLRAANAAYKDFAKKAGLRTQEDRLYVAGFGKRGYNTLSSNTLKVYPITQETIDNLKTPPIDGWDAAKNAKLNDLHKELLQSAKELPPGHEMAAYFDSNLSNKVTQAGEYGKAHINFTKGAVYVHNHPDNATFSLPDVEHILLNDNMKVLTAVGNKGAVYTLQKSDDIFDFTSIQQAYGTFMETHPDYLASPEKYIDFMEDFLNGIGKHGIIYRKNE